MPTYAWDDASTIKSVDLVSLGAGGLASGGSGFRSQSRDVNNGPAGKQSASHGQVAPLAVTPNSNYQPGIAKAQLAPSYADEYSCHVWLFGTVRSFGLDTDPAVPCRFSPGFTTTMAREEGQGLV